MSKFKNGGLDQDGTAERFGRLIFATKTKNAGMKGLRSNYNILGIPVKQHANTFYILDVLYKRT